ncbi:MAG: hypothetical protein M1325_01170, partial [Actinobacteria bacterium]|nr:hypothetical protein [Actinomycetota bacterium]
MPDTRTARTAYAALLALMAQPVASAQDWSFPYWNVLWLDALLRGLAEAPRDGVAHVTAPTLAPTTALTTGGYLAAGRSLEVVQTFVDAHGRETDASPLATISTGTAITDPAAAPTFGAIVEDATGFDGGLLEVWFSWTDAAGGETVASPGAATNLPYRSGGLKNQVTVILPSTPAVAGAAGANVY